MPQTYLRPDYTHARKEYEQSVDLYGNFATVVDDCFDAVHAQMKSHGWPFKGKDDAELLVAAIAHYLLACQKG